MDKMEEIQDLGVVRVSRFGPTVPEAARPIR